MKTELDHFTLEISHDISAVLDDWKWLEEEGLSTPFQRRAWLLPFYNILAPHLGAAPIFVRVRDRQTCHPVMLLPLCSRHWLGMTVIEFADLGVSDYNAPLIARNFCPSPSQRQELWEKIKSSLKTGAILWLKKMPSIIGGQPNPLMQQGNKPDTMMISSWGIALPSAFTMYNKETLHPSFAKELAKKVRRVEKRGSIEYFITQSPEEKSRVFDILAHQRQERCDEMGRRNILAQPIYRRFYKAAAVGTPDTLTKLAALRVGGEEVATLLALEHDKSLHVIMTTFKGGKWKSCSLGNVIMRTAIAHSIENGMNFFDFTIGNESYKQQFGATPNALYYALHPLARAAFPMCLLLNCYMWIRKATQGTASDTENYPEGYLSRLKRVLFSMARPLNLQPRGYEA